MDTEFETNTLAELVDDAAELAARALGCGLARMIENYVPPRLVGRFAMRVAVVLLRELREHEVGSAPPRVAR